jgi:hypothetical protein
MGKKKTKTEQVNRPVYGAQIERAGRDVDAAYNASTGLFDQFQDNATQASDELFRRFREGDPLIQAAQGYVTDALASDPASNPYLDDLVAQTNNSVRNDLQAQLGTRGLTGGSSYVDIIADALAQNELGLRYSDFNNQQARQERAAGMAPGLSAAELIPLDAALRTGSQGAMMPLQAALARSAGTGGLLGQYQTVNSETEQSGGLLGSILGAATGGLTSALTGGLGSGGGLAGQFASGFGITGAQAEALTPSVQAAMNNNPGIF